MSWYSSTSMTTLRLFLLNRQRLTVVPLFPPLPAQMAPVQNPRGNPQGADVLPHNLRLTIERKPEAGPQTTFFKLDALFHWIDRRLGRLSPSLRNYGGASHEGGGPPWIVRKSENSFMDLSPRFGDNRGCFSCFIMDNDPRVRYEGQWNLDKSGSFTTKHSSTTSGSKASLTFDGTGITVFGTVPASSSTVKPPTVIYRVDAAQPFTTTQPIADRDVSNQPLFSYAFGSQWEKHKIEIEVLEAQAPFTLEKFFIFPDNTTRLNSDKDSGSDEDENKNDPNQTPPTMPNSATNNTADLWPSLNTSTDACTQRTTRILAAFLGVTSFIMVVMAAFLVLQCVRQRRPRPWRKSFLNRPETLYTHFTSTDTILRNTPPSVIGSANYSRSDGTLSTHNRNTLDPNIRDSMRELPPLPPKAIASLSSRAF